MRVLEVLSYHSSDPRYDVTPVSLMHRHPRNQPCPDSRGVAAAEGDCAVLQALGEQHRRSVRRPPPLPVPNETSTVPPGPRTRLKSPPPTSALASARPPSHSIPASAHAPAPSVTPPPPSEFLRSGIAEFAKENPQLEVHTAITSGRHPVAIGEYGTFAHTAHHTPRAHARACAHPTRRPRSYPCRHPVRVMPSRTSRATPLSLLLTYFFSTRITALLRICAAVLVRRRCMNAWMGRHVQLYSTRATRVCPSLDSLSLSTGTSLS